MFISGVDKGSLSEQNGLCIGDQILSVNGTDFCHITHADAVQLLRNSNEMIFYLRQINKLPKPKDEIKPISINRSTPRIISQINKPKKNFVEQIVDLDDQMKMKNYLREYLEEIIHIDLFIQTLLQILNKQSQQNRVNIHFSSLIKLKSFFRMKLSNQ
jgi:hypothetical protein